MTIEIELPADNIKAAVKHLQESLHPYGNGPHETNFGKGFVKWQLDDNNDWWAHLSPKGLRVSSRYHDESKLAYLGKRITLLMPEAKWNGTIQ